MTIDENALGESRQSTGRYFDSLSPAHVSLFLRSLDLFVVLLGGLAAFWLAQFIIGETFGGSLSLMMGPIALGMAVSAATFHHCRCYWRSNFTSRLNATARLWAGWGLTIAALTIIAYLIKMSADYSRTWAILWFACCLVLLPLARLLVEPLILRLVASDRMAERVLLIGRPARLKRLREAMGKLEDQAGWQQIIYTLKENIPAESSAMEAELDHLSKTVAAEKIDKVVFTADSHDLPVLRSAVRYLTNTSTELVAVCDPQELELPVRDCRFVNGVPMLMLLERPIVGWMAFAKRVEDLLIASILLVFLAPLMVLIAIAVKLSSPGPIIFRQSRYGSSGRMFQVFKFRTLRHEASDPAAGRLVTKGDPRVTPLGHFLRRSSLDELPQLVNVLRGDMSIVGPRPHAASAKAGGQLYQDVYEAYMARHRVKPGITGWAQVNGWRGETDTSDKLIKRVEFDLHYIERWSILFDLYIILLTPISLIRFRDTY